MINKLGGKFTLIPTPILQLGTNANILKTGPQEVTEIFASHLAEISTKTEKENNIFLCIISVRVQENYSTLPSPWHRGIWTYDGILRKLSSCPLSTISWWQENINNPVRNWKTERRKHDIENHPDNQHLNSTFLRADLQLAIFQSKDSASGLDLISSLMISHLNEEQQEVVLKSINKLIGC